MYLGYVGGQICSQAEYMCPNVTLKATNQKPSTIGLRIERLLKGRERPLLLDVSNQFLITWSDIQKMGTLNFQSCLHISNKIRINLGFQHKACK